ncbi:DeoR family transcriptional regulator [Salmonella enterica subsp. enterica serovar Dublin]|nr:DeoR family transcriptional regulator [Salmonella enterica subsp. enterica serovar Dublin]EEP7116146.1 DeoR family transcriptional regulator [Salmonella enterica subsp. enterica serovar Dublin]
MKQTQRHDAIIELVKKQGYVSTEELVEHFSVSPQTIRRDLNDLAEQNRHCCKVSDEAAFCLIQRPYISKTLLTRRISPRGSP